MSAWLPEVAFEDWRARRPTAVDPETLERAREIIETVGREGELGLRRFAEQFEDIPVGGAMRLERSDLEGALDRIPSQAREVLERTAHRIRRFAEAQRGCLNSLDTDVDGGRAGHRIEPVLNCGCYAPGGRFPLPSTVLMTVVPARVAGVETAWVASPKPTDVTLAAAAIAGADGVLCVGGAQAIAAFASGTVVPACDLIVGPGNRWVTAAKWWVSQELRIDLLAGPSELLIVADDTADPGEVAADLLAQAEHDEDAAPMLVVTDRELLPRVRSEVERQIADLSTKATAAASMERNGVAFVASGLGEAIELSDSIAPEHLSLHGLRIRLAASRFGAFGAQFVGGRSAEVFADYGIGPNHVLPTGGTARSNGGLSVFTFLRISTWLDLDETREEVIADAAYLARCEGLEGHARAAEIRRP